MKDKLQTIALVFIVFAAATTFSAKDKLSEDPAQNDKITLTSVRQELPPAAIGPTFFPLIGGSKGGNDAGSALNSDSGAGADVPPQIRAASALAFLLDKGRPLLEWNAGRRWAIASITKLMTAVVALEQMPGAAIAISADDVLTEGSSVDLRAGEEYGTDDMVTAMIMVSSNDAAAALARTFGGDKFIFEMNQKAGDLGMKDTFFADETGLSPLNQSSPRDLGKLASFIISERPEIFSLSVNKESVIIERKSGSRKKITSNNKFAGREGFLGGKTGYTTEANGNLLSVFNFKGNRILIIVFGTDDRFGETEAIYEWAKTNMR